MKKIFLLLIIHSSLMPIYAQVYTGEPGGQAKYPEKKTKKDRIAYIGVNYFKPELTTDEPGGPFNENAYSKSGVLLSIGSHNFFSPNFFLNKRANIGLHMEFNAGFNGYDFGIDDATRKVPFIYADYKLGPSLSFEADEAITLALFFQIGPVVSLGGLFESDVVNFTPSDIAFGFNSEVGVQVKLFGLFLNTSYNIGSLTYKYSAEGVDAVLLGLAEDVEYRVSTNSLKLGIGFAF